MTLQESFKVIEKPIEIQTTNSEKDRLRLIVSYQIWYIICVCVYIYIYIYIYIYSKQIPHIMKHTAS